ncbi:MAG: bifunctional metallophosphatase/5'-nucleotidase [Deltaproteobacteria bacterium]|nr:bifunctional metallophosphatase/5'-nucleotidase [Deltaproteobacteria bacterium]
MKKIVTRALCATLLLALCGAGSCGGSKSVEITILHTNDIHMHFKAEPANSEKNPYNLGGLARLKTLVDRIRAQKPRALLLDAGDWSEAVSYFNVDAGSNMLRIMSAMGYNAAVVGNHDFLNGPSELASTIERASPTFPVLGANKDLTLVPDKDRVARAVQDYVILDAGNGIKVGVIGALCNDFFYYGYWKPALVTNTLEKSAAIAKQLHDSKQADVIVLLSHNTLAQNVLWAKQIPWVNVVVSGHSHAKTPKIIETSNGGRPAYVAEAKQWGQFLGEITLTVDKDANQTTLKSFSLHPVTVDLPEDPAIVSLVNDADQVLARKYGKDVAHDHAADADDEMVHDDGREVPITNMMTDAYRISTGADIAAESVQLTGDGIQPGPLSTLSLMNIMPHIYKPVPGQPFPENGRTWTLKRYRLKGSTLRGVLNLVFSAESISLISWIAQSGALISYDNAAVPNPIKTIKLQNPITGAYEDLDDARTYTMVFHDGILLALSILNDHLGLGLDLQNVEDTGIEAWQSILSFLATKGNHLHAADYQPGTRYNTLGADLGFYEHDIQLVADGSGGYAANVMVQNEGLTASAAGAFKLSVNRSAPDDWLGDFTDNNEHTPIGAAVEVPPLAPGARALVRVNWDGKPDAGIYGLKFEVTGPDANPRNNVVTIHYRVPARR